MSDYIVALKKYAVFTGRASRREYWMFFLFNILMSVSFSVFGFVAKVEVLGSIYSLAVFLPSIALSVRRMHDVNKSGVYIFIPVYGFILTCTAGSEGTNDFGDDPSLTGLGEGACPAE